MPKLRVGNLDSDTTDDTLKTAFEEYGTVLDATVERDSETGRSRGTGSVTMGSQEEADAAVNGLHGQVLGQRPLSVRPARSRPGAVG
ncbi:RNA recognition motif domain-containing protein [Streptomyces abikoensis]